MDFGLPAFPVGFHGGSSGAAGGGSSSGAAPARKGTRTPGRWKRMPRELTPAMKVAQKAISVLGILDWDEREQNFMQMADEMEAVDADKCDCDTEEEKAAFMAFRDKEVARFRKIAKNRPQDMQFRPIQLSDTKEEHPTAEEMEVLFAQRKVSHTAQLEHFSNLALAHYNCRKTARKFKLSKPLTSNCFSEDCGTMYAHVNFTALPYKSDQNDNTDHAPMTKKLFFAELMLAPNLRAHEDTHKDTEPLRVLHVCTIDDVSCYGGCHEIRRRIDHKMRGVMDYERCHACRDILKHPKGESFVGGHNSSRRPYYSAT